MKAVLWISRREAQPKALLLDRAFIQHLVEQLVKRGVSRIDLLLSAENEAAAQLLNDGTRWGIEIESHPVGGVPRQEHFLRCVADNAELVLLGDACCLPILPEFGERRAGGLAPTLYFEHGEAEPGEPQSTRWTGWALLPGGDLPRFAASIAGGASWQAAIDCQGSRPNEVLLAGGSIGMASAASILESNRMALRGEYPGLYHDGVERAPGVWVARGVMLAATAVLTTPCYIGEEAWIGEECHIGPDAVIGRECVVERGTAVLRSVLAEATYLGPGLEVADSSVVQNVIYNVRLGAVLTIEEEHVVSELDSGPLLPRWMKLWAAPAFVLLLTALFLMLHRFSLAR